MVHPLDMSEQLIPKQYYFHHFQRILVKTAGQRAMKGQEVVVSVVPVLPAAGIQTLIPNGSILSVREDVKIITAAI